MSTLPQDPIQFELKIKLTNAYCSLMKYLSIPTSAEPAIAKFELPVSTTTLNFWAGLPELFVS